MWRQEKDKDIMGIRKIVEKQRTEENKVEKGVIRVIQTNQRLLREVAERK